jgi:hypothetical protein
MTRSQPAALPPEPPARHVRQPDLPLPKEAPADAPAEANRVFERPPGRPTNARPNLQLVRARLIPPSHPAQLDRALQRPHADVPSPSDESQAAARTHRGHLATRPTPPRSRPNRTTTTTTSQPISHHGVHPPGDPVDAPRRSRPDHHPRADHTRQPSRRPLEPTRSPPSPRRAHRANPIDAPARADQIPHQHRTDHTGQTQSTPPPEPTRPPPAPRTPHRQPSRRPRPSRSPPSRR